MEKKLYDEYEKKSDKVDFGLLTLTLISLSTSLKFTSDVNLNFKRILVLSWILFLISFFIGSYRMWFHLSHILYNLGSIKIESFVNVQQKNLNNPYFRKILEIGNVFDKDNPSKRLNLSDFEKAINKDLETKKEFDSKMKKINKKTSNLLMYQFFTLSFAILLFALFTTLNFLNI